MLYHDVFIMIHTEYVAQLLYDTDKIHFYL